MSANLNLFELACDNLTDIGIAQEKFSVCLADFVESSEGNVCIEKFRGLDILGRDVSSKICSVVDSILNCSAPTLYSKCGPESITHVYSLHQNWLSNFNRSCTIKQDSGLVLAELAKKITLTSRTPIINLKSKIDSTSASTNIHIDQTLQKDEFKTTPISKPKLSTIIFEEQITTTEKQKKATEIKESTKTSQTINNNNIATTESSDNVKLGDRTVKGL